MQNTSRQFSLRFATVSIVAGFYAYGGTHAGFGNRWHDCHIHLDSRGYAPLVAGFRSRHALPRRRRRRLLRASGPQDRWGMYSFPLYERLKAEIPEFEDVAAFQAGGARLSVRREAETAAKPLRSAYVTGSYFSTLGVLALGGRAFTPKDDTPSALPVAVLSHHGWQTPTAPIFP